MGSDPFQQVIAGVTGYWLSRCVHVAAELGIADLLDDGPQRASELADNIGADADALNRVMRLLAAHGIFDLRADGQFEQNAASELLRSDHPQSLRAYARFLGSELIWRCWGELETAVRSGRAVAESVAPGGLFAWFADHPDDAKVFDEAMAGKAHGQVAAIVAAYDFGAFASIADIGGGRGHLLSAILAAAPQAHGVLFDLPRVIDETQALASARLELSPGDFFTDPLPSCDAYVLLEVIHDWDDPDAARILAAVRASARPGAKVLVIERVIPDAAGPHPAKAMDVNMLVLTGGRERTVEEFGDLFATAGLRLDRVVDTSGGVTVLEGSPA